MEEQLGNPADGHELTFDTSTSESEIVCKNIPKSGKGSAGYVVVARDYGNGNLVASNPVPLTGWHGGFSYTVSDPDGGANALVASMTGKFFVRGDVHDVRDEPDGPILKWSKFFDLVSNPENPCHDWGSGRCQDQVPNTTLYEWKGEGDIPPNVYLGTGTFFCVGGGTLTTALNTYLIHPILSIDAQTEGCEVKETDAQGQYRVDAFGFSNSNHEFVIPSNDILQGKVKWDRESGYDITGDAIVGLVPFISDKLFPAKVCMGFHASGISAR